MKVGGKMILSDEFSFNESVISEVKLLMSEWNKLDTIYCLESTGYRKEGIINKLIDSIKKIIKEVRNQVQKFKKSFGDHLRYGMLSEKKKKEFDKFSEWLSKNPSAKNKKVTVKDWERILRQYNKTEKSILSMMKDENIDSRTLNQKANDMIKDLLSIKDSASAALTVDLCMVFARKSPKMALLVQTAIENSSDAIENIEKQLGQKEVIKLQKNLEKLTKESVGHKILTTLFRQKEKTLAECVSEVSSVFDRLLNGNALDKAKVAVEHRDLIRTAGKSYIKDKDTRQGVNGIVKTVQSTLKSNAGSGVGKLIGEYINPKT